MMRTKIYTLILLFIGTTFCLGQETKPLIQVNSEVDTSRITIGDRIRYTISIDHVDTMRVERPGEGANLGQFEIKDYKIYDPVHEDGRIYQKFEYVISVFDTGTFVIPPFPVAYFPTDSAGEYKLIEASAITIYVESVIQDTERELRDIKPPIDIPYNYLLLISVLSSLILIGILVYYGLRIYRKRKERGYLLKPPEPPRPAHEIALEALGELLNKDLLSQGLFKQFYIEISDILRRYIEGRFFIPALEETSHEIMSELNNQELDKPILKLARESLDLADLVKFAKYISSEKENGDIVDWIRQFVNETMIIYELPDVSDESDKLLDSGEPVENNVQVINNEPNLSKENNLEDRK